MKNIPTLPVDPFTYHHPYFHQTTKEYAYSVWYIISLSGSAMPHSPNNVSVAALDRAIKNPPAVDENAGKEFSAGNQTSIQSSIRESKNIPRGESRLIVEQSKQNSTSLAKSSSLSGLTVPPSQLGSIILESLSSSFNISSALFHLNSVRTSADGSAVNFSVVQPSVPKIHQRLLGMKRLRVGMWWMQVEVSAGKVEHVYVNEDNPNEETKLIVFISFSLGIVSLILTVLMLAYFGVRILQKVEEEEKNLLEQDYITESKSPENPGESRKFLTSDIAYIELDATSLTGGEEDDRLPFEQLGSYEDLHKQLQQQKRCLKKVGL